MATSQGLGTGDHPAGRANGYRAGLNRRRTTNIETEKSIATREKTDSLKEGLVNSDLPAAQGRAARINRAKRLILQEKENRTFRFSPSNNSGMN